MPIRPPFASLPKVQPQHGKVLLDPPRGRYLAHRGHQGIGLVPLVPFRDQSPRAGPGEIAEPPRRCTPCPTPPRDHGTVPIEFETGPDGLGRSPVPSSRDAVQVSSGARRCRSMERGWVDARAGKQGPRTSPRLNARTLPSHGGRAHGDPSKDLEIEIAPWIA